MSVFKFFVHFYRQRGKPSQYITQFWYIALKIWYVSSHPSEVGKLNPGLLGWIQGCVHIDTSMSLRFRLWPVEVSLVQVKRSQSLVQAHNSTHVSHIENSQRNRIKEMLCH